MSINRSFKIISGSVVTFNLVSSFSAYCNPVEFKKCVLYDLNQGSKICDANNNEIKFQLYELYALFAKNLDKIFYFKVFHKIPECKSPDFFLFYNKVTADRMVAIQKYFHLADGFYDVETKKFKKPKDLAHIEDEDFKAVCSKIESNICSSDH